MRLSWGNVDINRSCPYDLFAFLPIILPLSFFQHCLAILGAIGLVSLSDVICGEAAASPPVVHLLQQFELFPER